jgi:alkylation response protein AidB-like acyl-CoA dehydrogenase
MDLDLSDDQVALRDGIRALLDGRFPMSRVRAGFDRSMWDELAEAGVLSLLADGFAPADACVVLEALGAACVPGPIVDGVLASSLPMRVDGVVAMSERPRPYNALVLEHLDEVDALLLLDDSGIWRVDPSTVEHEASPWPLDPLTPVARVTNDVPEGEQIGSAEDAQRCRQAGAVYTAAFLLGMADRLTEMSVAYAKEREQFDRPIGSFQAVKHLLADMVVRVELARAAVYAAGAHLAAPDVPGLARAVSTAKVMAGEAAVQNGKTATQVHGGMGFTWEVDVHLYLKRAWVLDTRFGSVDDHCDVVAATATTAAAATTAATADAASA